MLVAYCSSQVLLCLCSASLPSRCAVLAVLAGVLAGVLIGVLLGWCLDWCLDRSLERSLHTVEVRLIGLRASTLPYRKVEALM